MITSSTSSSIIAPSFLCLILQHFCLRFWSSLFDRSLVFRACGRHTSRPRCGRPFDGARAFHLDEPNGPRSSTICQPYRFTLSLAGCRFLWGAIGTKPRCSKNYHNSTYLFLWPISLYMEIGPRYFYESSSTKSAHGHFGSYYHF